MDNLFPFEPVIVCMSAPRVMPMPVQHTRKDLSHLTIRQNLILDMVDKNPGRTGHQMNTLLTAMSTWTRPQLGQSMYQLVKRGAVVRTAGGRLWIAGQEPSNEFGG